MNGRVLSSDGVTLTYPSTELFLAFGDIVLMLHVCVRGDTSFADRNRTVLQSDRFRRE